MPLPPDRSRISTEQRHPHSEAIDTLCVAACVDLMIDDHAQVIQALHAGGPALGRFIEALVPRVRIGGRLIYIGAGTSGRLGVLDAAECPPTFQSDPDQVIGIIAGDDTSLRRSSESREDEPAGAKLRLDELHLTSADTVLGIAAGGTTPYVLGALSLARESGAVTGLLTCSASVESPPADCDHLIILPTGAELITGSTRLKAGTATKLALNIITTTLFVQLGKVFGNLMVDLRASNDKLRDRAIRIVCEVCAEQTGTKLSRQQADALLERADDHVKTAIVMHTLQVTADEARMTLNRHQHNLRECLTAGRPVRASQSSPAVEQSAP